jgi:hypothetical protein
MEQIAHDILNPKAFNDFIPNPTQDKANTTEEINLVTRDSITIKNQANVIKDLWSELQGLKRILINNHKHVWDEIQKNRVSDGL